MRYELTDQEWAAIKPMLPNKPRGVPRVNDRRVLNGISGFCDLERRGAICRAASAHTLPATIALFCQRQAGVWSRIIDALAAAHDSAVQMIDTSIVRVHQHAASIALNKKQSMGRSRRIPTRGALYFGCNGVGCAGNAWIRRLPRPRIYLKDVPMYILTVMQVTWQKLPRAQLQDKLMCFNKTADTLSISVILK
jgi:transposase